MAQTLTQLVDRTITRLSMETGTSVQIYAEDQIAEMIWHKYIMCRDELWWDDLMDYHELTQDSNGRPVENVVKELPEVPAGDEIVINKFTDIQYGWSPNLRSPLKKISRRYNPQAYMRQGRTLWLGADNAKVVRFFQHTPGLVMLVRSKRYYPYFAPTDEVPMDEQLMILGAAYDYLEDDGTNPGATEKFRNLFNERLDRLKSLENEQEVQLSPSPYQNESGGWQVVA